MVVAVVWSVGTRQIDLVKPPTQAELESARTQASQKLARPSNLFALPNEPDTDPEPQAPVKPIEPAKPNDPPRILFGELEGDPPLDAWTSEQTAPAASFIDLASRLEADTRMAWARVAWERVIDQSKANPDELQAALKGVARTSLTPTPLSGETRPKIQLFISAPRDRVELSKRAAAAAAESLSKASSGLIAFTSSVTASKDLVDELEIGLGVDSAAATIRIAAPTEPANYSEAALQAAYRLIGSQLATNDDLRPITPMEPGEKAPEALATRVTRLAWLSFATAFESQE